MPTIEETLTEQAYKIGQDAQTIADLKKALDDLLFATAKVDTPIANAARIQAQNVLKGLT